MILIEPHIVKGRGILRPNCCAAGVGHHIGEVGASFDDANTRRIKFGASFVGQPHQQPVVGRMFCDAEPEKRLSLGERIPVKEELLLIHFLDHLEPSGGD